jgi:hypothetical protein
MQVISRKIDAFGVNNQQWSLEIKLVTRNIVYPGYANLARTRCLKMSNSRYVGWKTRMVVILRDQGCFYCTKPVFYCTEASRKGNSSWRAFDDKGVSFHFDHRRLFALGGTSGPGNIVLACAKCNLSKGSSNRHNSETHY